MWLQWFKAAESLSRRVLSGFLLGGRLLLNLIKYQIQKVAVGDTVVTSGTCGVFPVALGARLPARSSARIAYYIIGAFGNVSTNEEVMVARAKLPQRQISKTLQQQHFHSKDKDSKDGSTSSSSGNSGSGSQQTTQQIPNRMQRLLPKFWVTHNITAEEQIGGCMQVSDRNKNTRNAVLAVICFILQIMLAITSVSFWWDNFGVLIFWQLLPYVNISKM